MQDGDALVHEAAQRPATPEELELATVIYGGMIQEVLKDLPTPPLEPAALESWIGLTVIPRLTVRRLALPAEEQVLLLRAAMTRGLLATQQILVDAIAGPGRYNVWPPDKPL